MIKILEKKIGITHFVWMNLLDLHFLTYKYLMFNGFWYFDIPQNILTVEILNIPLYISFIKYEHVQFSKYLNLF